LQFQLNLDIGTNTDLICLGVICLFLPGVFLFQSGFSLLLDRIKENMHSCKDAVTFLKRRAVIEEEYAKAMIKLCQTTTSNKGAVKEGYVENKDPR
jgi:hypothetical protein